MGGPQVKKHLLSAHFFKPVLQLGKLLKNFCSVLRIKKKVYQDVGPYTERKNLGKIEFSINICRWGVLKVIR